MIEVGDTNVIFLNGCVVLGNLAIKIFGFFTIFHYFHHLYSSVPLTRLDRSIQGF